MTTFWHFEKQHFKFKTIVPTFWAKLKNWATFGAKLKNWATYYSNIWSHLFDVSYHFCTTATFQYFSNTSLWATIEKIGLLFIPTYGHIRSVYHFILCNPVFFQQLGWEPWSSDYEFISRYCILDGHFFIFICCKKCKVCLNGRK